MSLIESKLGWMCVFYFFVIMVRPCFVGTAHVNDEANFHWAAVVSVSWLYARSFTGRHTASSCCDSSCFLLQTGGSIVFITPLLFRELCAMWRDRRALRSQLWERQLPVLFLLVSAATLRGCSGALTFGGWSLSSPDNTCVSSWKINVSTTRKSYLVI